MGVISGFLNLYKPLEWTSHDCVARVRRLFNQKRVGHGGTLDPAASGVLPIALGRGTRLLQFLPKEKVYRATIRFGVTTTTDDLEGHIVDRHADLNIDESAAIAPLKQFVGTFIQTPPSYSAVQVNGQRLYSLARKGKSIEVPQRQVTVNRIVPIKWIQKEFPELVIEISCETGTYIRSIARDWGEKLGTGATLAALERIESSGLSLTSSLTLEELSHQIETQTFVPIHPDSVLPNLPVLSLSAQDSHRWQQGQKIFYGTESELAASLYYRIHNSDHTFVGISSWRIDPETNQVRLLPKVVFLDAVASS